MDRFLKKLIKFVVKPTHNVQNFSLVDSNKRALADVVSNHITAVAEPEILIPGYKHHKPILSHVTMLEFKYIAKVHYPLGKRLLSEREREREDSLNENKLLKRERENKSRPLIFHAEKHLI
ncbi:hypothetical protein LXL04_001336 [Taraxacum kok-saghyz]